MKPKQTRGGQAPIPVYYKLQMELLKGIEEGRWAPGEAIPPERRIAEDFGVSLGTVNRALANLVTEGYLHRIRGKGTFVAGTTLPPESVRYTRLRARFGDPDPKIKIKFLDLEQVEGFQPANRYLKLRINQRLWRMRRIFLNHQKRTLICYTSFMPVKTFPDLDQIPTAQFEKTTLYETIEKRYGLPTIFNQELFSAVAADHETAAILDIPPGEPVLQMEMLSFTYKDRPYEYRISYCPTGGLKMFREM